MYFNVALTVSCLKNVYVREGLLGGGGGGEKRRGISTASAGILTSFSLFFSLVELFGN